MAELEVDIDTKKKIHDEVHFSTLSILKHLAKSAPVYTLQGNVGITTVCQARERTEEDGFKNLATRKIIDDDPKIHLVKNRLRILNGLRVGFLEYFVDTCWVWEFRPFNYKKSMKSAKRESDKARRILKRFGNVDILVCHQPPYGFLDKSNFSGAPKEWKGKHAGSKVILDYIKKFQPKYVFCGHIHEGEGKKKIGKTRVYNLGVASNIVVEL